MIQKVTMYTVICDNCGKDSNADSDFSCWNDMGWAQEEALESDWIKEEDKHYCPDCYEYDDDDNLVIKQNANS